MSQQLEQLQVKIEQRPCHICGGKDFEWGYVDSAFQPGLFTTEFDTRQHLLASRKCLRCGNVQMFADEQSTKKVRRVGCWVAIVVLLIVMVPLCVSSFPLLQVLWMIVTGQQPADTFVMPLF